MLQEKFCFKIRSTKLVREEIMKEQREQESKVLFIFFEYSVMCGTELTQENRPF